MTISQTGQTSIIASNNLEIFFDDLLVGYSDSDLNGTNQLSVANVAINGQPLSFQTINNLRKVGYILNPDLVAASASPSDVLTYDIVGADGEILSVTRTLDAPEQTIAQDIFDSGLGGSFPNPLDPGQNILSGVTQPLMGLFVSADGTTPQFIYNGYELVEVTSLNGELVATPNSGNLEYQYTSNEGFSGADQLTFTFRSPDGTLYTERRSIEVLENNTTIQKAGTLAEIDANVDPTSSLFTFYATEDGFQSYNSGSNDNRDSVGGEDSFLGENYTSTSDDGTGDTISLLNVDPYDSTAPLTFSSQDVLKYYQKDGATLSLENVKFEFSTNLGNVTVDAVYDSATDTFTAASVPEGTFGAFFSVSYEVSDGSGVNLKGQQINGDGVAPPAPVSGPVVEKGVEGQDFLYANALKENRDNDRILKRGEDSITGHYWVNNRDSSQTDNLVDGGEYAVIMGRRGELTADLTADEIIGGLESGDFVATKSFTSYGGYAVNAAFADGQIDSLVESANPAQTNNLTIGRIDATSGELITGFGGALRNVNGSEIWDNFDPSRSLSGRNDNAFGDVLAQQNDQTGGF